MTSTDFWDGWSPVLHTLVIGTVGYLVLVLLLRGAGPRTMASMTPLDFVIAVTLGSAFGRVLTAVKVSLVQAVAALVLLVVIQWVLAAARARFRAVRRLLDAPPVLLYHDGRLQNRALRRERLTEADVHTAAREAGHGSLADVAVVVLDQDGSFSVVAAPAMGDGSAVLPYVKS